MMAVAQPLGGRDVQRVQERLGLLQRQPVTRGHADVFPALHARDAGGRFRRQQAVVGRRDR